MVFNMKKTLLFFILLTSITLTAQNDPVLIIDNVNITFKTGVSLPYWLKAGQTVDLGPNARSASILEFTINNNNLIFSQAISLTVAQTVPANKVWKIEGIGIGINSNSQSLSGFSTNTVPTIFTSPKKFETPGTFNWVVPPSVTSICVEVWGGGGNGGTNYNNSSYKGGGGGGGGYGYQCFTVVPGTVYSISVAGPEGTSSVGSLISATGGTSGTTAINFNNNSFGLGGNGGSSNATFNISGSNGLNGDVSATGGNGGNGGIGGASSVCGLNGSAPGGGGSGSAPCNGGSNSGARGQVYIYW